MKNKNNTATNNWQPISCLKPFCAGVLTEVSGWIKHETVVMGVKWGGLSSCQQSGWGEAGQAWDCCNWCKAGRCLSSCQQSGWGEAGQAWDCCNWCKAGRCLSSCQQSGWGEAGQAWDCCDGCKVGRCLSAGQYRKWEWQAWWGRKQLWLHRSGLVKMTGKWSELPSVRCDLIVELGCSSALVNLLPFSVKMNRNCFNNLRFQMACCVLYWFRKQKE